VDATEPKQQSRTAKFDSLEKHYALSSVFSENKKG